MKKYEVIYIIHPDLEGSTAKITDKIKKTITDLKGAILEEEHWGKKKLAYKVAKNSFGIYELLTVEIEPSKVKEVERSLRISEEIIRSLVVLGEAVVQEAPKKVNANKKATKEKFTEESEKEIEPPKKKETKESKKTKIEKEIEEKERQKELDEKLKEIIGD